MVGKIVPEPFTKTQNWAYLWISLPNGIKFKVLTTCFDPILTFFKKQEVWNWPFCLIFSIILEEKKLSMLYSINWSNFIVSLPLRLEIFGNMYIDYDYICYPVYEVINFEIYLSFFIKPFPYSTKKSGQEFNILGTERVFNKNFSSLLIGF